MTEPLPITEPDRIATGHASGQYRPRSWPRRHRFATFAGALVTLALLLRLGWGWHSSRRLAAALEDVRRRGEPIAFFHLAEGELPPSENAWTDYSEAVRLAAASGADSPRHSGAQYAPYAPRGEQWEALAAASEKANAAAFRVARRARRLDRLQFPQTRPPSYITMRPEWNQARFLANTIADGAEYAHLRGDDAEAVERLLDGLHLGRLVRQDPTILSQLTGIGVSAVALDAAQQVIPTLRLDGSGNGRPASPAQTRLLLAAMLDERRRPFAGWRSSTPSSDPRARTTGGRRGRRCGQYEPPRKTPTPQLLPHSPETRNWSPAIRAGSTLSWARDRPG